MGISSSFTPSTAEGTNIPYPCVTGLARLVPIEAEKTVGLAILSSSSLGGRKGKVGEENPISRSRSRGESELGLRPSATAQTRLFGPLPLGFRKCSSFPQRIH